MKLLEQITGKRVQVTCLTEEQIDVDALMDIAAMEIDELMTIDFDENVIYSCSNFINLSKRLEKPINRFDFHMIIAQIAHMHKIVKKLHWRTSDVLWNPDYVYMSPTTREVKFIYLPNNDIENNSITDMLERIIYSAIQSNDEDTYLSEFVYYLKRLGAFSSEEIIEFVMEQDSKVTRLLQLKKPITYTKPIRSILKPESEIEEEHGFDVPDFEAIKVAPEEAEEIQLETDAIPDVRFNVQDAMGLALENESEEPEEIAEVIITENPEDSVEPEVFEELVVEEPVEEQAEEPVDVPVSEEVTEEAAEEVVEEPEVEEPVVEEEVQSAQPRLSFTDLFSEDEDLGEESYFDVDLDSSENIQLEEEFEPLTNEEIEVVEEPSIEEIIKEEPKVEETEEMVVEDPVDLTPNAEKETEEFIEEYDDEDESTQEMFLKQEDIEEPELPKGYITRLSNEQKALIDLPEFIIGKSSFVNGLVVKGNPGVSRKHAMIRVEDGQYYIRDLDSVNGTYINDAFVEPETEVEILNGDSIKLGDEEFTFTIE
ncbi:MAG: FHA domain-containing protein [Firmicutes bacterium]|nr:FHA domain-containing protein [Bacillota bacterium]